MAGSGGKKSVFGVVAIILIVVGLAAIAFGGYRVVSEKSSPTDAMRGVVYVYTEFNDGVDDWMATGTGFFVGIQGQDPRYLITNGHVIQDQQEYNNGVIRVYFNYDAGDYIEPTVAWVDYDKDIAVLDLGVTTDKRIALPLLFFDGIAKGEQVYALGYPGASEPFKASSPKDGTDITITTGIVGEKVESYAGDGRGSGTIHAIQTDTAIVHGNSGGPLVNAQGDVIGINTWGTSETETMNWAIAIDEIVPALDELGISYSVANHVDIAMIVSFVAGALILVCALFCLLLASRARRQREDEMTSSAVATAANANANALAAANAAAQNAAIAAKAVSDATAAKASADQAVATATAAKATAEREAAEAAARAARQESFTPILLGKTGQFEGRSLVLGKDKRLNFGRDASRCNLVFDPAVPGISAFHCSVSYDSESDRFKLEDHNSTYGTFFGDGQRIDPERPAFLAAGDSFYLANRNNSFQVGFKAHDGE